MRGFFRQTSVVEKLTSTRFHQEIILRDIIDKALLFISSPPGQVTLKSLHKNQLFQLAIWTCSTTGISNVAIIIIVASNDPRKHEATNKNRLHFTASRNFQSGDLETLVAFTPDPSVARRKKQRKRGGGRRNRKKKKEVLRRPSRGI